MRIYPRSLCLIGARQYSPRLGRGKGFAPKTLRNGRASVGTRRQALKGEGLDGRFEFSRDSMA
eukprot:225190-Pyramimonas_sp.AAC.1